jgi:phosphate transport system substrate-binding protein
VNRNSLRRVLAPVAISASLALTLAACGGGDGNSTANEGAEGGDLSGTIRIDGSSTVAPLSEPAGELFMEQHPNVRVTVGTSGTGGGFEKFCNGEIDISDASRQIKEEEIKACEEAGIKYTEISVANDGLAVAVNPENDWAQCLTVDELSKIWTRGSDVDNWSDVREGFPDERLELYGPGSDSGTFDYFTEAVNGEEGVIRTDYNNIGEDDNAAVTGVSGSTGAMGYIPLSFVKEAGDQVKAIEVENESGECVAPSEETVQDGSYNPLGRQLFVYPSDKALQREEVVEFLKFYIENGDRIAEAASFIPLTDEQKSEAQAQIDELAGS